MKFLFTTDWVSRKTAHWAKHLADFRGLPNLRMLEIGTFEGRSALWFLENVLTHQTSCIACIDTFTDTAQELRFIHNLRDPLAEGKATMLKGRSEELLPSIRNERFDIIYVDGNHLALNVLFDGISAFLLLKPNGVILFDDYLWRPELPAHRRPQFAIDLILEAFKGQYEVLHKQYQVVLKKHLHLPHEQVTQASTT